MRITSLRTVLIIASGLSSATIAVSATPVTRHVARQTDALRANLLARADAAEVRLVTARRAGRISFAQAARLRRQLAWIRADSAKYVRKQGFLSAAESASYDRALAAVEAKLR